MNRRGFLKTLLRLPFIQLAWGAKVAFASTRATAQETGRFYLLCSDEDSVHYWDFRDRIAKQVSRWFPDWSEKLTILNRDDSPAEFDRWLAQHATATRELTLPLLVRVPEGRSEGDVEIWNLAWLNHYERGTREACYPVSGGWWSVDGDFSPTLNKVKNHLYQSPNHTGGHFIKLWLDLLYFEELQSLHSDHHREMVGEGKVAWTKVNRECPH